MQINNLTLSGRLASDVSYSATKNGTPRAKFNLANTQKDVTEYYPVVSFGKTADYCHNYLSKGQKLTIIGRIHHYAKKIGNNNYDDYWSVIAQTFDPVHAKNHESKAEKKLFKNNEILTKRLDEISRKVNKNDKRKY